MTKSINISITLTAQTKMALHASKHGLSNPIHGIVLGKQHQDTLQVVDVIPVCHEVPTKPIVDMALRLTDAHLQQQEEEGVRVVGWYTANPNVSSKNNGDDNELPNTSACRIVSSMAESAGDDGEDECFVLLLVSTSRLVDSTKTKSSDASFLPICTVFEKDKSRTFTQRVDKERIITDGDGVGGEVLSNAVEQQLSFSENGGDAAAGGDAGIVICDYVDHLMDCGRGDWIENGVVNKFVLDSCR